MSRTIRNVRYSDDDQARPNYKPPLRQSTVGSSARRINSDLIDPDLTPDDGDEIRSTTVMGGRDPASVEQARTPNTGQNLPFGDNLDGGVEEHEQSAGRAGLFREKGRSGVFPAPSVADQMQELESSESASDQPQHRRRDPLRAAALQKLRAQQAGSA